MNMEEMLVADIINDVYEDNVVFFDVYCGDRYECNMSADKTMREFGNLYASHANWTNDAHDRLEIFIKE